MQFSHVSQVRSHLYFNLSGCDHPVQTNTRKVSHQAGIGCLQISPTSSHADKSTTVSGVIDHRKTKEMSLT